jgi:integrase
MDRIVRSFPTKEAAEAFLLECKAAVKLGKPIPDANDIASTAKTKAMTIGELLARVDKKRWRGNPNCKSADEGSFGNADRFVRWIGPKVPVDEALSEDKINEFVEEREDSYNNSGSTINRYMAAVSALASEAVKLKLIDAKPDLPRRGEGQSRMRIFTTDEEAAIQKVVRQWGYEDHADLFVFLIDTGCRPGETHKLTWQDIALPRIHLDGAITKNSTPRTLTGTPRVREVLERMKTKYGHTHGPFSWAPTKSRSTRTLWNRLRGHFEWMGGDTVVYTFRHTCASRLVQRGIDLYRVQIWMGHKSMLMTQRYAKFAPKHMAELADVLAEH